MTKLRVEVLSFPDFTDISIIQGKFLLTKWRGFFKSARMASISLCIFFPFYPPFGYITRKRTKILFSAGALCQVMASKLQGLFLK
jgi:hypothetical protein